MHNYFLKRLVPQELGSQECRGGKTHRGRYMLISKSLVDFFPPLSENVANDFDIIQLFPVSSLETGFYCTYTYHNSKKEKEQTNGRDEYRIYFPQELDDKQMYAGDIVVFRRKDDSSQDGNSYYFGWFKPEDEHYSFLASLYGGGDREFPNLGVII